MASLDLGDFLTSALALLALITLIWQVVKIRTAPLPTWRQFATVGICGFIVSLASGFLVTVGLFIVAIRNSPGWPHGSQNSPDWVEHLFVFSIPLGIGVALIGFTWTARFISRQATKPLNPATAPACPAPEDSTR